MFDYRCAIMVNFCGLQEPATYCILFKFLFWWPTSTGSSCIASHLNSTSASQPLTQCTMKKRDVLGIICRHDSYPALLHLLNNCLSVCLLCIFSPTTTTIAHCSRILVNCRKRATSTSTASRLKSRTIREFP